MHDWRLNFNYDARLILYESIKYQHLIKHQIKTLIFLFHRVSTILVPILKTCKPIASEAFWFLLLIAWGKKKLKNLIVFKQFRIEFPYPKETPFIEKTSWVKNTNSPVYNFKVVIPLNRLHFWKITFK